MSRHGRGAGAGGGANTSSYILHITGETDGINTTGTFPIVSPNQVQAFRNYSGANANFIVVPVGLKAVIEKIVISGAPATGSATTTLSIQVCDDANAASPTFSTLASYTVVLSSTTPPSVYELGGSHGGGGGSGSDYGAGGDDYYYAAGDGGAGGGAGSATSLISIEPRATLNANNILSTTALRFNWTQSAAHKVYIHVFLRFVPA
ncbi:MAG: hypothetical protein QXF17_07190 [Ignisphaera sp.]